MFLIFWRSKINRSPICDGFTSFLGCNNFICRRLEKIHRWFEELIANIAFIESIPLYNVKPSNCSFVKTKNWCIRLNIDDTSMTFAALSHLHILFSYFSYFHHGHGYCAAVISGAFSSQCWRSRQLWSFKAFIQGELWDVDNIIGCIEIFQICWTRKPYIVCCINIVDYGWILNSLFADFFW